jgi:hypothetical protein
MTPFPPPVLACALALLCAAGPALAQRGAAPAPPKDAPPPAEQTDAAVDAWRLKNIVADGATYAFRDEDGVVLFKPDRDQDPARMPLRIWVRSEHFETLKEESGSHRSDIALYAFDCPLGRYRLLAMDLYPQLNLQGGAERYDAQTVSWTYPRPGETADRLTWYACGWAADTAAQRARARR